MSLEVFFSNPFDPDRSIQLNNKYWPNDKFTLLNLIEDCEGEYLNNRSYHKSSPFKRLKTELKDGVYYDSVLRRLGKLREFDSDYGYERTRVSLSDKLLDIANGICDNSSVVRAYPKCNDLIDLQRNVKRLYLNEFGWDLATVHKSIRFATPNEITKRLVSDFGPMSEYHNDELKGITCVVYLSDVAAENGAFSFIDGSERIPRSFVLTAIHQTVCFDMSFVAWNQMGSLPLEFRSTPTIGNFINTEKVVLLLRNNVILEGKPGEAIIFNGHKLIHRGGMPLAGFRCAAFMATEGLFIHKIRSFLSQYSYKVFK